MTLKTSAYSVTMPVVTVSPQTERREHGEERKSDGVGLAFIPLAMAFGLPNVYRLPTVAKYSGDLTFVVAWAIVMLILGLPLLFLELTVASFSGRGPIRVWAAAPLFKGIGLLQVIISALLIWSFSTVTSFSAFYLDQAFFHVISSGSKWDESCISATASTENEALNVIYGAENCFREKVLALGNDGMRKDYNFWLILASLTIFLLAFIGTSSGFKRMSSCLFVTSASSAVIQVSLSALLLFHYVAFEHLRPSFSLNKLLEPRVWIDATVQALFSLHLSCGVWLTLASKVNIPGYRLFGQVKRVFTLNFISGLTSILLSYACYIRARTDDRDRVNVGLAAIPPVASRNSSRGDDDINISADDIGHPFSFLFVTFHATAERVFSANSSYAIIAFSIYLITAGLNSLIPLIYSVALCLRQHLFQTTTTDGGNNNNSKCNVWKTASVTCLLFFLLSLTSFTSDALYLMEAVEGIAASALLVLSSLLFCLGFTVVYGRRNLDKDFIFWIGEKPRNLIKALTLYLTTVAPILFLIVDVMGFIPSGDDDDEGENDAWVVGFGWTLYALAYLAAVLVAVRVVSKQIDYGIAQKLFSSMKPALDWGPRDVFLQRSWKESLRQGVVSPATFRYEQNHRQNYNSNEDTSVTLNTTSV